MQLAENTVVAGRFRLTKLLGRGGMGSVWTAIHLGLDIPCAVKFIEGEMAGHPEAQERFKREAKAAAALRSPHVVQILDHGVSEGRPYIAMELLEGEDLGKRLLKLGRIEPTELVAIVTQVCRALTKAHSLGVVHRDLKPDNIFLVRDDDREIAKVLDFGIAKQNSTALDGGSNTKTGAMLGTPYYMSPEQAQGTKSVDSRSDLWSLAVIAFQCFTGRLPFESEALGDLLVKIIVQPLPVPSQMAPGVPASFDRWFAKAAQRDPNLRYQSAKEFAHDLSAALGVSQLGEVTDHGALETVRAQGYGPLGSNTPVVRPPYAITPHPVTPPFGGTPNPGAPRAFAQTPASAMARSVAAEGAASTPGGPSGGPFLGSVATGAPIYHTFPGQEAPGSSAKAKGLLALAGVLALVVVIAVAWVTLGRRTAIVAPSASATTAIPLPAAPVTLAGTSPPAIIVAAPVFFKSCSTFGQSSLSRLI